MKYRKIHPSPKPPALLKDIIEFFTKSNGKILDPFCGVGGTLLGTAMARGTREAIGIELESKYIEAYRKVCEAENMRPMAIINDDSNNMLNHPEIANTVFDLIIADPPYSDMMCKERTGQRKKLYNDSSPMPYTNDSADFGNISELLAAVIALGIDTDEETLGFDILNLRQAGIHISKEQTFYRLMDTIKLDIVPEQKPLTIQQKVAGIEKQIEHYVMVYEDSLPPKLVDNLIRYGYDGTNSATLFEATIATLFSFMGYETQNLGQGHGRVADVIAKYRDSFYSKSYGLIIDTKAYEKYTFLSGDVRKMKEYILLHGKELLQDMIPQHAFAFISMAFNSPDEHLNEIARDTGINGTAIDVFTLLELGSKVMKQELSIAKLYPKFSTNKQFLTE